MENYSLLMGAAAVMKMAVEMAAVSMEKPSGHFPAPAGCRNRDSCPPDLGFAMAAALELFSDAKTVNQKDKDAADLMTWRDYEALRNEMRREFRTQDDELRGSVHEISQKLDATNETVTTMTDQMMDIQRSLQALQLVVDNLTQ
ncbi:hypothetical protein QYE76_012034 [Lolium multiflorum]|uniref:Uncharacterized protein n=1 Tax=Lolium multiflorum TaxID=4521 RepID=A0AAD8U081_LOLMU|nr:hypothetical protein QYE76_012034 [Lolium multiflorum]